MLILRKGHVAVSNLRVDGHISVKSEGSGSVGKGKVTWALLNLRPEPTGVVQRRLGRQA